MRWSGLTTPTLALLTTASAKQVSPIRSRCSSKVSVALVTSTTGTRDVAPVATSRPGLPVHRAVRWFVAGSPIGLGQPLILMADG